MSELVLYTSDDGKTRLDLRVDGATVWLTQLEIAELFQTTKQNVSLHAKNILEDGELSAEAVIKESLTTASDGKNYRTLLYNLDLILAIGYRVRSPRGVQFRQWATSHLKEYLHKGFVLDDERLKNPGGWDYFDELLERIREIRASEKRFYQKVRDLFALSADYAARESETQIFFAEVQNKLLYAATGHTAAEIIVCGSVIPRPIPRFARKVVEMNTGSSLGCQLDVGTRYGVSHRHQLSVHYDRNDVISTGARHERSGEIFPCQVGIRQFPCDVKRFLHCSSFVPHDTSVEMTSFLHFRPKIAQASAKLMPMGHATACPPEPERRFAEACVGWRFIGNLRGI